MAYCVSQRVGGRPIAAGGLLAIRPIFGGLVAGLPPIGEITGVASEHGACIGIAACLSTPVVFYCATRGISSCNFAAPE